MVEVLDPSVFDPIVEFPLHLAAQQGKDDIVRHLLSSGECVNHITFDSVTPLHDACLAGRINCVRILLEAGANVNARNIDGATPLCEASNNGSPELVHLLLSHGAEVNPKLNFTSPLHEAVLRDMLEAVKLLIEAGADLNKNDLHFGTPLHVSAFKGHIESAKILLEAGAKVDAVVRHQTALHLVAKDENMEFIALLLDHGASLYARNNWGKVASDLTLPGSPAHTFLKHFEGNPYSLMHLCRVAIRNSLPAHRLSLIQNVNLPGPLKSFLLYRQ